MSTKLTPNSINPFDEIEITELAEFLTDEENQDE